MKIGIYSDVHCSYTSSILPLHDENSKYTKRLKMIIDSYKWMYEEFSKHNVELILNGGDTFDSHTIRSEELTAITEAYSYSKGIPEYHILGNHDTLDTSRNFYSTSIFDSMPFVTIVSQPMKLNDQISLLPYMKAEDIDSSMLETISNKILLSHIDIYGSHLRPDYIMSSGVSPELLSIYFDNVLNGHLHTYELLKRTSNNGYIMNVGNLTSISFSDNNSYIPGIMIFDTDTYQYERIENPYAILFRKFKCNNMKELSDSLNNLEENHEYCIRVTVPFILKDSVTEFIENNKKIIAYRLTVDIGTTKSELPIRLSTMDNTSIVDDFEKFIDSNQNILKYPKNLYDKIIEEVDNRYVL